MESRAEFLFRHRLPALLRRTWPEIMLAVIREEEARVAENAAKGWEPSTEPYIYYDPHRRYRRWYWKCRLGADTITQRPYQQIWRGPYRLTEAQAIEDYQMERDWNDPRDLPIWGKDERKAIRMMREELWQPDPLHNIGQVLLDLYEPNISTRWTSLFPLWVLADTIRLSPQGTLRKSLIKQARMVVRDVLQTIRYDRQTRDEEEDEDILRFGT